MNINKIAFIAMLLTLTGSQSWCAAPTNEYDLQLLKEAQERKAQKRLAKKEIKRAEQKRKDEEYELKRKRREARDNKTIKEITAMRNRQHKKKDPYALWRPEERFDAQYGRDAYATLEASYQLGFWR